MFDDDFIDSYIELKMAEVMRFEHDPAPGRVRHVLLGLRQTRLISEQSVEPLGFPFAKCAKCGPDGGWESDRLDVSNACSCRPRPSRRTR